MARSTRIKIANIQPRDMGRSKSHDVVAAVHVDGLASDAGAEIRSQEEGCIAYFPRFHIPFERSMLRVVFQHCAEVAHAARGQRLDGPGGYGVYADVLWAQAVGQVA